MHFKVNNGCKSAFLNLIEMKFFRAFYSLKSHLLFHSNDLLIWHGFPDIIHNIKVKNSLKSAILNLIELKKIIAYPSLKVHILLYSNGLAISNGLLDITYMYIKVNYG